jgi:hypothetical protein
MTTHSRGLPTVVLFAALASTCNSPETNLPTTPSAPVVVSVEIVGPSSVPPEGSAQFAAMLRLSNGVTKQGGSAEVRWRTSQAAVLQVNADGVAKASSQLGDASLTASVQVPSGRGTVTRSATREVVVVPEGTYRLTGLVTEAGPPATSVIGVRVEVVGGASALTGSDGRYRLFGVPPDADIRVAKPGYESQLQHVQLATHATQNFALSLAGPRLNLAGQYTLTVEVTDGCPGTTPLSTDLRRRTYDAVLSQNGPIVDVTLTEPRFRLSDNRGNRFAGRVDSLGATFGLDIFSFYFYYYGYNYFRFPNVVERLADGTHLEMNGAAVTTGSRAGLSGSLNGALIQWDSRFPNVAFSLARCSSSDHRFTLTPR